MSVPGNEIDTISLFEFIEDTPGSSISCSKIDVVKLNYEYAESVTRQELFSGS